VVVPDADAATAQKHLVLVKQGQGTKDTLLSQHRHAFQVSANKGGRLCFLAVGAIAEVASSEGV